MTAAQIELQREYFTRQEKRDKTAEAARVRLEEAQAMPKEQVIHQHITNVERPEIDISTFLDKQTQNTEQRMYREMQKQFSRRRNDHTFRWKSK